MSAMATIGALGAAMAGMIGERMSPRILTLLALGALTIASTMLVQQQTTVTLGVFTVAMGVGFGFSYVGTAMLLLDYFGRRCNLELYSVMCMISTSAAIGPALGGMQRDHSGNFIQTFEALGAIGAVLFVIVLFTRRPKSAAAVVTSIDIMPEIQPVKRKPTPA
jgi:MFS family permease